MNSMHSFGFVYAILKPLNSCNIDNVVSLSGELISMRVSSQINATFSKFLVASSVVRFNRMRDGSGFAGGKGFTM